MEFPATAPAASGPGVGAGVEVGAGVGAGVGFGVTITDGALPLPLEPPPQAVRPIAMATIELRISVPQAIRASIAPH